MAAEKKLEDLTVTLNKTKRKKKQNTEKNPKRPRSISKKKPGFDKDIFKETEYYIRDGLRYVKPYPFTFTTYCKGRWLHRKLLDVLSQEFQSETTEYYRTAIENGNITVNGAEAKEDLILKDNDIISHKVHRHEPPVTAEAIQIIAETEDLVVVNKPSSIPIHPCGRYRHNTLVFLLGREFGLTNLYTIHRIDRLTSGIVMFAKSLAKAQELEKQLREHKLHKEYVCKVCGEFPSHEVDCIEPIAVVSHKVGVCRVHVDGKLCRTVFTRETFDGTNSIVRCRPFTGRMHQIRVHLQWLGHPIVDDPIYNHEAWGPGGGKGGVEEEKAWKVIESIATSLRDNDAGESGLDSQSSTPASSMSNEEAATTATLENCDTSQSEIARVLRKDTNISDEMKLAMTSETLETTTEANEKMVKENEMKHDELNTDKYQSEQNIEKGNYVNNCTECKIERSDPTPEQLNMCLHAAVYKGPDWEFRCPWPAWAVSSVDKPTTDCENV